MLRMGRVMLWLLLAAEAARASPYWISYDPGTGLYPEQTGWQRIVWYRPAQRYIEDGAFVIDSRESTGIVDFDRMIRPGATDPGLGEVFIMEWRLKVEDTVGYHDSGVGVCADTQWAAAFLFNDTTVSSLYEPGVSAGFAPGVFHDFRFVSADMRNYALFIDGQQAIAGVMWYSAISSQVSWGDDVQGGASLGRWGYFRFGVVPECGSAFLMGALLIVSGLSRTRARR
jgi:hypothetical protein